jgi:hypothetical protein
MSKTSMSANFLKRTPQHGGAVGDHGHQVPADGVLVGEIRVLLDLQAGLGHAGAVGEREIARGGDRLGGNDLDLPLAPTGVIVERVLAGRSPLGLEGGGHGGACLPLLPAVVGARPWRTSWKN